MNGRPLTSEQERKIEKIKAEWANEIRRVPALNPGMLDSGNGMYQEIEQKYMIGYYKYISVSTINL